MKRFWSAILLGGLLGTAAIGGLGFTGLTFTRMAFAGDPAKCTIATSGDSEPAKACARGGRAEAKKTMKTMVADAKTRGQKFSCDGCHKDLDSYELTRNARDDLRKLEALVANKK